MEKMKIISYGEEKNRDVIILHGGGLGPWSVEPLAERLSEVYHVLIPYIPGHAGSGVPFDSIEKTAKELIHIIDNHMNGQVFLVMGLSLGADIALEMLSRRRNIAIHAIIESANVIPTRTPIPLIRSAIRLSYPLTGKESFARTQFKQLRLPEDMFDDYFRDTSSIDEKDAEKFIISAMTYRVKEGLRNTSANVHIVVGDKENRDIRNSANLINTAIENSTLTVIPDLYHGEASIKLEPAFMRILASLN